VRSLKTLEARIAELEAKLAKKNPVHVVFCAQDLKSDLPYRQVWIRGCAALIAYRDAADITPAALASALGDVVCGPVMLTPAPDASIDHWEAEAMQQQAALQMFIQKERETT
jgi:hypothetical protein